MSPRSNVVLLNGGLGNQLFQFAYLHNLSSKKKGSISCHFPKSSSSRDFMLQELCDFCDHVNKVQSNYSKLLSLRLRVLGFLNYRFPDFFKHFLAHLDFTEQHAYLHSPIDDSYKYYSGYFQNWRYVYDSINEIESEIQSVLKNHVKKLPELFLESDYGIVHYRQGDLLDYRRTMGVLNVEYFQMAISTALKTSGRPIKVIVLTDDKMAALRNLSHVADRVYGPEEISEWQGLAAMSNAKFVITANSTFSWWGALLASKKGAEILIPSPWFLNWNPSPGDAFNYPGFKTLPSIFEE